MTFEEHAQKTRSRKATLCWVEPTQRVNQWTLDSGTIYTKSSSHFVVDVIEDGTSLSQASSAAVSTGEWFFDADSGTLYVNASDDLNPSTHTMFLKYRKFYASEPFNLPYDLASGSQVHYEGLFKSNSPITQELDDE